jgi:hypothetical protein
LTAGQAPRPPVRGPGLGVTGSRHFAGWLEGVEASLAVTLVRTSQCREERTLSGLDLDRRLREKGTEARCGVAVVELATGSLVHWLELGGMRELYDVQALPGVRCSKAVGLQTKEIWGVVTHEEDGRIVCHTEVPRD